jgi:cyclohexanone monooxygenase
MRAAFDHPLGFYPYSGIKHLLTDEAVNARIADFMRREVRRRVHDPATAEALTPRGYHVGTRRILGERGYYEIYNRPDVTLADVRADPIRRVVAGGVELASGVVHELDTLILATGFDSGTGALAQVAITGREGRTLAAHWADGPVTYLGLGMAGFPNMFMVWGPGSPSLRSQGFVAIEQQVDWLADLLDAGAAVVVATPEAERAWTAHADELVGRSLLARDPSQYNGANVAGKPRRYLAYTGGTGAYGTLLAGVAKRGYEGWELVREDGSAATASTTWSGPHADPLEFRLGNSAI